MTGIYSQETSFLDEAIQNLAEMEASQPLWVKAAASRLDAASQPSIRRTLVRKRAFDVSLVVLSAPVWLPVLGLLALAVRLDSRGSSFFRQQRTGLNGRLFSIYKFRTMHDTATGDFKLQSKKNDNRHTRIGRLLRRTSLDELPQILNVLTGDMSLIGPRPHARYHDELFAHYANGYAERFRVRPGLTGWAQVHGQRGLLQTKEQLQARTDFDNHYIENGSFGMDIKILFKTVGVVFKATNAH